MLGCKQTCRRATDNWGEPAPARVGIFAGALFEVFYAESFDNAGIICSIKYKCVLYQSRPPDASQTWSAPVRSVRLALLLSSTSPCDPRH